MCLAAREFERHAGFAPEHDSSPPGCRKREESAPVAAGEDDAARFPSAHERGESNEGAAERARRGDQRAQGRAKQYALAARALGVARVEAREVAAHDCGEAASADVEQLGRFVRGRSAKGAQVVVRAPQSAG